MGVKKEFFADLIKKKKNAVWYTFRYDWLEFKILTLLLSPVYEYPESEKLEILDWYLI